MSGNPILIVYDSKTGNVERFVNKLNIRCVKITKELIVNEPYVLITYTTGFGEVPETTAHFLNRSNHNKLIKGVCSSGNTNWGKFYAGSSDVIAFKFNIPILHKFELLGTNEDVEKVLMEVEKLDNTNSQMD